MGRIIKFIVENNDNKPKISRKQSRRRSSSTQNTSLFPKESIFSLSRFLTWAVIAVIAWAPLPFGSARPWAWGLLGVLVAILLCLTVIRDLLKPTERYSLVQLRLPLLIWGLLACWVVFQCLPWNVFGWHHPLWDQASDVLGKTLEMSLSVDREESWIRLFHLLTYGGFFLVAWQVGGRVESALLITRAIAFIGAFYTIYGLIEFSSAHPHILWIPKQAYKEDVTSTFINRNSYATFAGLCFIANLVLIARHFDKYLDSRTRKTFFLSSLETCLGKGKWALSGMALTGSGLFLSHSRGGLTSTFVGVLALLLMTIAAPSFRGALRIWFAGFIVVASFIFLVLSGDGMMQRIAASQLENEMRPEIAAMTMRAIGDNLFFGTGLGTFQYIFKLYQPASMVGFVDLAHNDYLENILELGAPAAILFFGSVLYLAILCFFGARRRRKDAIYPCAGVAATVLVGVHSTLDFSLQIPAVTIIYIAILGVGMAQSVGSNEML